MLLTGSYNWSRKVKQNDENIIITEDARELCHNFINEFEQIRWRKTAEASEPLAEINTIIKRLQILKNLVLLEDFEEILDQVKKLTKQANSTELQSILSALKNHQYGRALFEIDEFIQQHQQLTIYDDPQIFALQLELKACEIELNAIENELIEIEKDLHEFAVLQILEVGAIIIEILRLKKLLAKTPFEKQEAEKAEEEFNKTFQYHQKEAVPELSEDERKQLTKKYREASMLCHPDKFQNEPEKLEIAAQLFVQLNEAYKANNREKVEELLQQLKSPDGLLRSGKVSTKKDELLRQLNLMKNKIKEALKALTLLKSSDTFAVIKSYPDKKIYFNDLKSKLGFELSLLQKEALEYEA